MGTMEITLIVIGVVFLLGSFFVQDKLSRKDMEQIAKVSEDEINIIMEKQLTQANSQIENKVEDMVESTSDTSRRVLERLTNEKIMAINEYSDTVLENINKSHNEVMFLYSMLNDKHTELTQLAGKLSDVSSKATRAGQEMMGYMDMQDAGQIPQQLVESVIQKAQKEQRQETATMTGIDRAAAKKTTAKTKTTAARAAAKKAPSGKEEKVQQEKAQQEEAPKPAKRVLPMPEESEDNHNLQILKLHQAGKSDVDIAKELGVGLGEVRLVIGLYRGEM